MQVRQKPPAGRSGRQQPAGGSSSSSSVSAAGGGGGGGGSSGASSSSSSTRASPAGTIRAAPGHHGRPALASNFSLDDITAQLEKVRRQMWSRCAAQHVSDVLSSSSSSGVSQHGRSCPSDLLALPKLRLHLHVGHDAAAGKLSAPTPPHGLSGHRERPRGKRSSADRFDPLHTIQSEPEVRLSLSRCAPSSTPSARPSPRPPASPLTPPPPWIRWTASFAPASRTVSRPPVFLKAPLKVITPQR